MVEIDKKQTEFIQNDYNRRTTSVNISDEDWKWAKSKGLQFTQLLHEKIKEERDLIFGENLDEIEDKNQYIRALLKRIENIQFRIKTYVNFLEKKQLIDEYLKENAI